MKTCVLLSGGLDSSVLLYSIAGAGPVCAVSIDYGQRHRRELRAAAAVAKRLSCEHTHVDLSSLGAALPGSSQTDERVPVPHGHYEDASMRATVVPNRNMILLAVAAGVAIARGAGAVAYAAHAGDHAVYPDCRAEFADALGSALALCHYEPVALLRPFVSLSKADIVRLGARLGVPFEMTWSCYEGGETHCGKCGTCVERREAFTIAGVEDPTRYA